MPQFFPIVSFLLAITTFVVSVSISQIVNDTPFSTVQIIDLSKWGGVRLSDLNLYNIWRVLSAQLVHVKWPHMLYNVFCLFGVGALAERHFGRFWTLFIWGFIGGLATLVSPIFVEPPYNFGTGASQAVLAFVGCAIVLLIKGRIKGRLHSSIISLALLPAIGLDLFSVGYIKIGHLTALVGGATFAVCFLRFKEAVQTKTSK